MPKRIQRKPIRQIQKEVVDKQSTTNSLNIQEFVTVLGGVTGIIVAILWIAGRFYMAGYFGAMNIPTFQTNFSIWEYAEVSWLKLIFYFLRRIYPILLLLAIVPLTILSSAFILQRIFPRLKMVDAINKLVLGISKIRSGITYVMAFTVIFIFSYILLQTFTDINKSGQTDGQKVVLSSSYAVQVFSRTYLPLGPFKIRSETTPSILEYNGLRLLTYNNGKYYLFRKIDRDTCKPSQVFVVTDSPDIVLVFNAVAPTPIPCSTTEK